MNRQTLGYVGAGLLVAGLFLPVVTLPFAGNVTLMGNGTNFAALALLVLGGISAVLVAKDRQSDLVWPGLAAAAMLIYLFGRLQYNLAEMRSSMKELADNPFGGAAQAAMGAVQIQWGWLVLAAGAGILIYLAMQARKEAEEPLLRVGDEGGKPFMLAAIACFLVAPAQDAWGLLQGNPASSDVAPADVADAKSGFGDAAADSGDSRTAEEAAYIRDHLKVYNLEGRYFDSLLDGRVPGVDFKIKNDGDRTLDEVKVKVVFYDDQDKPIGEEEYYPVLVTSSGIGDNTPLRPNYIWQQESGQFYSAKSVPSEWKTGKVSASITDIEFAPDE